MENDSNNIIDINSNDNNIKDAPKQNEYQKMTEYYEKIRILKNDNYRDCFEKGKFCDCIINGEWAEVYIDDINDNGFIVIPLYDYYVLNNSSKYRVSHSDRFAYLRKHTKPFSTNIIKNRDKKNNLAKRITKLLEPEKKNIFKDDNMNNKQEKVYDVYYFLHSYLYKSIDYSICKSKDKSAGVEEGFRIIVIILEYLSEFFHYINNNFESFLNYKNTIADSELADIVILDKKYAIFSFWDEANLLMEKIFVNNADYLDWFVESEKVLQKIVPSSPNMKKITSNEKLLCPLYENQTTVFKNQPYNYTLRSGNKMTLSKICMEDKYKSNNILEIKGHHIHTYILCYLIDYFHGLGGYKVLFSLCRENPNIKIAISIFDNIIYGCTFTNNFKGIYESEKNGISQILFTFINTIDNQTLKRFSRNEIVSFLKKGSLLFPNMNEKSTIFEQLYFIYILKNLTFAKKKQ